MILPVTLTLFQVSILTHTSTSFHLQSVNIDGSIKLSKRWRGYQIAGLKSTLPEDDLNTGLTNVKYPGGEDKNIWNLCNDNERDQEASSLSFLETDGLALGVLTTTTGSKNGGGGLGEFNPDKKLPGRGRQVLVGDPQKRVEKEYSVSSILKELSAIQEQGPQKYCVLGTRHCSYLHQRIIELLAYALVLSGNHVYTSGAGGTHAATIRGALRAERPDLLTVVLPQSRMKQPKESQELLQDVTDIIEMPQNDSLSLDVASRICNSYMLSCTDHLVAFVFHESKTIIEATREAKDLDMLVTTLYLD